MAYTMAVIAEHPVLISIPISVSMPRQHDTDTLAMYTANWQHYLLVEILNGTFYSDRFFLEMYQQGLNKQIYKEVIDYLRSTVLFYNTGDRINAPLPDLLIPNNLLTSIQQFCSTQRIPMLCIYSPKDNLRMRRERFSTSSIPTSRVHAIDLSPIQQVFQVSTDIAPDLSDEPLSANEDQALLCHALTSRPSGCFWCGTDTHQLTKCPLAATALANSHAWRIIRSWLQPRDSSTRPSGAPTTQHVHMLGQPSSQDDSAFDSVLDDPDNQLDFLSGHP
jgi:hypothetical protein